MRITISRLMLLALVGGLAACSSTHGPDDSGEPVAYFNPSKDPYWQDPRWDKTLLDTVQAAVHNPADPADTSTPGLHATVKFTYLQGTLEYPAIVTGTGNPDMDKLILHQLAAVQGPLASGLRSDEPHEFVLDMDMPTPFESFLGKVYYTIDASKIYPKESILRGIQGTATVEFDYLDGKASGIGVTASSKDKELDRGAVMAVTKAILPSAPAEYAGKSQHLEVVFCYVIRDPGDTRVIRCPSGRNVIVVHGFRIRR